MKAKLLAAVVALQSAWVLATVVIQERELQSGTPVLLTTRPVDPRDLLRGDYLILRYGIGEIPFSQFRPPLTTNLPAHRTLFVALKQVGEFHEVDFASTDPIDLPGTPVLRGKPDETWRLPGTGTNRLQYVHYGIERYYVREGAGNPRGALTAKVVVSRSGRGLIRQVFVDGRPL